jgi:acyl-CoA thioesterase YciA
MAAQLPNPPGGAHLRTIAMPRDANPSGDIFGGWTLSQMDLAGATLAAERSGGRVATVSIDAMKFLHPIAVGDEVSCFCFIQKERRASIEIKIETWTRIRGGKSPEKVTEGVFTFVALDEDGKPRALDEPEEQEE